MERAAACGSRSLLLAVSGGPDSVYLARTVVSAWRPYHPRLVIACVDHGMREESAQDIAFTARLAADLSVPFRALCANRQAIQKAGRVNEARLRAERYRLLSEAAREHGGNAIWLAHHRDDQVESVILAALRGGRKVGLAALAGMGRRRRRRDGLVLVRPLLRVPRAAILTALADLAQPYQSDASNQDPRFLRNHVRHVLLPELRRELGSAFDGHVLRLARIARALLWRAQRRANAGAALASDGDALHARLVELAQETGRRPTHRFIERAQELLRGGERGRLDLESGVTIELADDRVTRVAAPAAATTRYVLRECERAGLGARLLTRFANRARSAAAQRTLHLDAGAVHGAIRVRTRRPGDRIHLLTRRHEHKLKDLFGNAKVPPPQRAVAHVFEDDIGLIAVEGLGLAKRVAISATTSRVLRIQFRFDCGSATR